jgi:hypothetical protein
MRGRVEFREDLGIAAQNIRRWPVEFKAAAGKAAQHDLIGIVRCCGTARGRIDQEELAVIALIAQINRRIVSGSGFERCKLRNIIIREEDVVML